MVITDRILETRLPAFLLHLMQSFSMSIVMYPVEIKYHIAITSTRDYQTGFLCPKPGYQFWKV